MGKKTFLTSTKFINPGTDWMGFKFELDTAFCR